MKPILKRGLRVAIVLAIILVAGSAFNWFGIFQPRYHWRTATYWLDRCFGPPVSYQSDENFPRDDDFSVAATTNRFKTMGPRAILLLGQIAATKNIFERAGPGTQQNTAQMVLAEMGQDAAPALPPLLRMFHSLDDEEANWAANVLVELPPEKIEFLAPELITNLAGPLTNRTRDLANISILLALGPRATSAVPVLWQTEKNGGSMERSMAAAALWRINRETNALVECVSNALSARGRDARQILSDLTFYCEPPPKDVFPWLEKALRHPDLPVRYEAFELLARNDPERLKRIADDLNQRADELLQAHMRLLESTNAQDRVNAMSGLPLFGAKAAAAAPRLVEILGFPREGSSSAFNKARFELEEKQLALDILQNFGSNSASVAPLLVSFLNDKDLSEPVCDFLAAMGPAASVAAPNLEPLLNRMTNAVRNGRFQHFNQFSHRPPIHQAELTVPAARALASINPEDSNAVAVLRENTSIAYRSVRERRIGETIDSNEELRTEVLLWKLGVESNSPVQELIFAAGNEVTYAIDLLGDIGPDAIEAVPTLKANLTNNFASAASAALAIMKIDPAEAKRIGLPGLFILCPDKY